jgi:hypothetical protein
MVMKFSNQANSYFLDSIRLQPGTPKSSEVAQVRRLLLRIAPQAFAPSCFHSASSGSENAKAAPEGGI